MITIAGTIGYATIATSPAKQGFASLDGAGALCIGAADSLTTRFKNKKIKTGSVHNATQLFYSTVLLR
ncbi:MAG: hypothetical protein ACO3EZ_01355 [Prochlorotrichaceae cyanobacterium]